MPAALVRLFSVKESQPTSTLPSHDEREEELKKTLGILRKPALSVTEVEKQLLQAKSHLETMEDPCIYDSFGNHSAPVDKLVKPVPISSKVSCLTPAFLCLSGCYVQVCVRESAPVDLTYPSLREARLDIALSIVFWNSEFDFNLESSLD